MGKRDMQSPLNIVVRAARLADASALKTILFDTFESTWLPNITREAAQSFREENRPGVYVGERGLLFWLAEHEGEVIGFVDWKGDFVNALHVRSSHARSGVGKQLMDKAEAEIVKAGFHTARLETDTFNTRSRAFYAARGYVEARRYPDKEWNSGLTTILLDKTLD